MTVFQRNLDYLALRTNLSSDARFWISDARTITVKGEVGPAPDPAASLPVLCTQTAPFSNETFQDVSDRWQISVTANGETLIG